MNFEKLKQVDAAKAIGVTSKTLQRWADDGLPRNPDGSYSLPRLFEWATDRAKNAVEPSSLEGDRWLAVFRRERAKIAKIERRKLQGKVISVEDVASGWAARIGEVKRMLMGLAYRLPPVLVGKDRGEMFRIIDDEVYAILCSYQREGQFCEQPADEANGQEE